MFLSVLFPFWSSETSVSFFLLSKAVSDRGFLDCWTPRALSFFSRLVVRWFSSLLTLRSTLESILRVTSVSFACSMRSLVSAIDFFKYIYREI